jgi:adenine-specific DNA-methyltransferase
MRYIGSKVSTLHRLSEIVSRIAPAATSLCDPFAGTCSVARHFKRLGFRITTGDLLATSYIIQVATVGLNRQPAFRALLSSEEIQRGPGPSYASVIAHLSRLPGRNGFITKHFSPAGKAERLFFTVENARKIDSIRETIRSWSLGRLLTENEEALLLATLTISADKVANTAATYYAYLKQFSRKAVKPLQLEPIAISNNKKVNTCNQADALEVASSSTNDILYLDPPYNERDYSGYYHLPETIIIWDKPHLHGMSGVPKVRRTPISDFCVTSKATPAFENLILNSNSTHILVHYTPRGLIRHNDILAILGNVGRPRFKDIRVRSYAADSSRAKNLATHRIYWCKRSGRR